MEVLRRKAETVLKNRPYQLQHLWSNDTRELIHELNVHQVELQMQNEELCNIQAELHKTSHKYEQLYNFAPVGYLTVDADGLIAEVNNTFMDMLDIGKNNLISRFLEDFVIEEDRRLFHLHFQALARTGRNDYIGLRIKRRDGSGLDVNLHSSPVMDDEGGIMHVRVAVTDISYLKRLEKELQDRHRRLEDLVKERTARLNKINEQLYHEITDHERYAQSLRFTTRILKLLNEESPEMDAIRQILTETKKFTGFDAVAIRLKDGHDYPYYRTNGFPERFVVAENSLCARDDDGRIALDAKGNPYLECVCGNVIAGRTDPSLPFFTEHGSFWTNSVQEFWKNASESDRRILRGRCHGEGYETVALIPLRIGRETIGLLQLNDHEKDRMTPELLSFFEDISPSIGVAVKRKQMQQQLLKDLEIKQILMREIHHRTKNNMMAVKSILYLQSMRTQNKEAGAVLKQAMSRITSMALAQEQMYKSDLTTVNLKKYTLELAQTLFTNLNVKGRAVSLSFDMEEVLISIDEASYYGLVLNELITNALKYAFPGDAGGTITVGVKMFDPQTVEIRVADNGCGMPAELDIRSTKTLGYDIVRGVAEQQLKGRLEVRDANPGTEVIVRFPVPYV